MFIYTYIHTIYMYNYIYIYMPTTMKKEDMNLEDRKEGYMGVC